VQWRQTLANRTLALHLPGGRQLFVTTAGALWTLQQRPVEYAMKEEEEPRFTSKMALKTKREYMQKSCGDLSNNQAQTKDK